MQRLFTGKTLFSWQTDCREPSRSHRYQFVSHNDVINSILVHFFAVYIFVEAGLSAKIAKICTQRKFPAVRYQCLAAHDPCILYLVISICAILTELSLTDNFITCSLVKYCWYCLYLCSEKRLWYCLHDLKSEVFTETRNLVQMY